MQNALLKLETSGIQNAASRAGWFTNGSYWHYPVDAQRQIIRAKAHNSAAKTKYYWVTTKPAACNYYLPYGETHLTNTVAAANGVLYIANGEKGVLTYHAAGLYNVTCWFGENNVPAALPDDLARWGVQRVVYHPDLDEAGRKSARKIAAALANTGIQFDARQLPDSLPAKGDTNDLWIAVGFDADVFIAALNAAPALPEQRDTLHERFIGGSFEGDKGTWDDVLRQVTVAMEREFNIQRYSAAGWSNNFANHWRNENHASAGYNHLSGVMHDFGGETLKLRELAERFNIPLPQPKRNLQTKPAKPAPEQPHHGAWWPDGVPDSWRSAALRYLDKGAALLLEVLNHAATSGLVNPAAFTFEELYAANVTLGYHIREKTFARWFKAYRTELISSFYPEKTGNSLGLKSEIKYSRGRKAETYALLPLDQLRANILAAAKPRIVEQHYGVEAAANTVQPLTALLSEELVSEEAAQTAARRFEQAKEANLYPLMEWERVGARKKARREYEQLEQSLEAAESAPLPTGMPLSSTSEYVTAYARALKLRHGDQLRSKRQIAAALGISEPMVNKTLERAGIEVEGNQFERQAVTAGQVAKLDQHVKQAAWTHRGYPKMLLATLPDGTTRRATLLDCGFAQQQLAQGAKVEIVVQVANKHHIADVPPEKPPRPPREKRLTRARRPTREKGAACEHQREHQRRYAGYSAAWLRGQIALAFDALGWRTADGRFMNQQTGEIVPEDATLLELIEVYVGEMLSIGDSVLDDARRMGARIKKNKATTA